MLHALFLRYWIRKLSSSQFQVIYIYIDYLIFYAILYKYTFILKNKNIDMYRLGRNRESEYFVCGSIWIFAGGVDLFASTVHGGEGGEVQTG